MKRTSRALLGDNELEGPPPKLRLEVSPVRFVPVAEPARQAQLAKALKVRGGRESYDEVADGEGGGIVLVVGLPDLEHRQRGRGGAREAGEDGVEGALANEMIQRE